MLRTGPAQHSPGEKTQPHGSPASLFNIDMRACPGHPLGEMVIIVGTRLMRQHGAACAGQQVHFTAKELNFTAMVRRCPGQLAQRTGGEDGVPSFLPTLPSSSLLHGILPGSKI